MPLLFRKELLFEISRVQSKLNALKDKHPESFQQLEQAIKEANELATLNISKNPHLQTLLKEHKLYDAEHGIRSTAFMLIAKQIDYADWMKSKL